MKRIVVAFVVAMSFLMTSCDYFGDYTFEVVNKSGQTIVVSYYEQLQSMEDILPTYEHGNDYEWIHLADTPTVRYLSVDSSFSLSYDIGQVSSNWPTEEDTPEEWHIVPLWNRIDYIIVGTDTIDASEYTIDKWSAVNNCVFTLTIR